MILDNNKIKSIRHGQLTPLIDAINAQKEVINTLMAQQQSQNERLERLTTMMVETLGAIRSSAGSSMDEAAQRQLTDAIQQLSQISVSTMTSLSKISAELMENSLGRDGLEELAEVMVQKNKRSEWSFEIVRDSNGRMTSIKAKEVKS